MLGRIDGGSIYADRDPARGLNHILDMIPKPIHNFYLIASRNDGAESFWFQIVCCMEAGARSDRREKN